MLRDVIAVQVLEAYRLRLRFDHGIEGEIDVAREISFSGVFQPLKNAAFFRRVRVDADLGEIVWPNGADLDPIVLYARLSGQPLPTEKRPVTA